MLNAFAQDVLSGLGGRPKSLAPKYLYDARGSALFERITELPEYYLTRAEREILEANGATIAEALGRGASVVELGPGAAKKTRLVLSRLAERGGSYVGVDLSETALATAAADLRAAFPALAVRAVVADFFVDDLEPMLPERTPGGARAVMLMGSNIGNANPEEQRALLRRIRALVVPGEAFVLGVDLVKDEATLVHAYDDASGVTAEFNRNVLVRINRELGGRFDVESFAHRAVFHRAESRIEMHLVSGRDQAVRIDSLDRAFHFDRGETIHTESSYKFTLDGLDRLARDTGFLPERVHRDAREAFAVAVWRAAAIG